MKRVMYVSLFALLFATTGCRKLIDRIFNHPPGEEPIATCRINTIANSEVLYTFKYNSQGNLDSVVPNTPIETSASHLISFMYDDATKLIGMKRLSNVPAKIDVTHKYGYTGNLITRDTLYDVSTSTYRVWLGRLTYDSLERVSRETREIIYSDNESEIGGPFIDIFYHYDAEGNLLARDGQGFPEIVYDEHKNLLRTDKLLQFIARDYSMNNPVGANNYNLANVPTEFTPAYNFIFYPHEGVTPTIVPVTDVSYSCEVVSVSGK